LNSGIFNNKKQAKQVAVCRKVNADNYYQIAKQDKFFVYYKILLILININRLLCGKKIKSKE